MRFPPCLQSISSQRSETGHTRHEIFQLQNYRNQTCGASLEYNLPFRIEFNHVRVRPVHLHPPLQPTARRRVEDISTKMTSRSIGYSLGAKVDRRRLPLAHAQGEPSESPGWAKLWDHTLSAAEQGHEPS